MSNHGRLRSTALLARQLLSTGWQCCATPAGTITTPEQVRAAPLEWLDTVVPTTAAGSLRAAGRWSLDGPPRNFDQDDWWYRCRFTRFDNANNHTQLCFAGLATVADVWLNNEPLLHSDNMFLSHHCDITARLQDDNELLIRCSPLEPLLNLKRPRPRWKAPMIQHQQLRWWRTTVLGRTPGWSPPAAAVGPWREVWLECRHHIAVENVRLHSRLSDNTGTAEICCDLMPLDGTRIHTVTLQLTRGTQVHALILHSTTGTRYQGELQINNVAPWWPHTHGEPALYTAELCIDWQAADGTQHSERVSLGHTGFRRIQIDTGQDRFKLSINDTAVLCRGACWTPPDVVMLNSTSQQLLRSLTLLRDAGMNMVRVSGTMVYENDEFLELCDELGILLWQDCMFANMDFPDTDEFMSNVHAELQQQFARLRGHPCLALICGNSEAEQQAAMFGAARERWSPALFHEVIPALVREHLPDTFYWPSSAHGGAFPHQNNAGTTSYYGVGAYLRPLTDARLSEVKFASECLAFAHVPEPSCIAGMPGGAAFKVHHPAWKQRTPRDLGAGWDFEDVRDHYLQQHYAVDPALLRYSDHDRYLELSRLVTGEVMAATFTEWRRPASRCGGALIWLWQDLWRGAGWGVLDADQQPKAAYYFLKRALQPVSVSLTDESCNGLAIHLHNERPQALHATLELLAYRIDNTQVAQASTAIELAAHTQRTLPALSLFDYFADHNHAYRFGPMTHDLVVARLLDEDGQVLAQHHWLPMGTSQRSWPDPGLSVHAQRLEMGEVELTLRAQGFAKAVHVDCNVAVDTDQYFHLLPGEQRVLRLRPHTPVTLHGSVKSLNSAAVIGFQT